MNARTLLLAVAVLIPTNLLARQWTDDTGQHRREAEYLRHDTQQVWLTDGAGRMFVVARERLSAADRQYVAMREQPRQSAADQTPVTTLAFRMPPAPGMSAEPGTTLASGTAATSIAKLTGWHCHGGHCYVTVHHPPMPVPPAPPTSIKRIYTGCYSTFHLVCRDPAPAICGTGAYKFNVGGYVREYLVRLRYFGTAGTFRIYTVADAPAPLGITYWYFEDPATPLPCYRIYYYRPGTGVVLYDPYSHRRIPE
ncbi:MAG: SHD1 domain-containing protein [Pirellulales bacterium]